MYFLALFLFTINSPNALADSLAKEQHISAPVEVAGIHILDIHNGIGSFSPADRASAITKKIQAIALDKIFDENTVAATEREGYTDVVAADITVVSLTDQDASAAKLSRAALGDEVAEQIKIAIKKDREARSPRQLITSSIYAGIATLALLLLLFGFSKGFPRIFSLIKSSQGTKIKSVRIRSLELLTAERITSVLLWLAGASRVILTLLVFYIYVPLVLSFFPWTANLAPKLFSFVLDPLKIIGHVIYDFLPNLFFIFLTILVTRYVLSFIKFLFNEIYRGGLKFDGFYKEWAMPTYKMVRFLVMAFALVIIFPFLPGSGSPAFQGVSVFVGVLFSFGSSSAIANMVSGIVITYMRPFAIGDRVKIADTVGDIIEKNLLITRIRTIKNVDVTIPNSMVLGSHMINYSSSVKSAGLILHTTVTIGYDAPWRKVHELLREAAGKTEFILKDPSPFILQTSLDDSYVSYEINAYTDQPNKMAVTYSRLHENIQDSFNAAGVEIMSPLYGALRDGNETTIPEGSRKAGYTAPSFRINSY